MRDWKPYGIELNDLFRVIGITVLVIGLLFMETWNSPNETKAQERLEMVSREEILKGVNAHKLEDAINYRILLVLLDIRNELVEIRKQGEGRRSNGK